MLLLLPLGHISNSYAPDDVAMDAAKQEKFLEGLNDELSITSVTLTSFTWTPLNSTVVPMTQQRRKGNNETTQSSRSIVFTQCLLLS